MKKDPILNLISFMENFDSQVYHHRAPLPPHALTSNNPLNTTTLHYPPSPYNHQMAAATTYQDSSYLPQHSSQNVYLNQRNCYPSLGNNLPCSYPNSFLKNSPTTTYHQYGDSSYPSASVIQRNSLPCREPATHSSSSRFLPHAMGPSPSLSNQVSISGKSYPSPYQTQVPNTRMLNDYLMKPCTYPKPLHQQQQQIQEQNPKSSLYPAPSPASLQSNMGPYYPKYTGHFTSLHGTNYTSSHHPHAIHESKPSPMNLPPSRTDTSQIAILNSYSISQQKQQHCAPPASHYIPDSVNITPLSSSSILTPQPNSLMQTTSVIKKNPILERLLDNGMSIGLSNNDGTTMNCLLSTPSSSHHDIYEEIERKPDISQLQLSLQAPSSHSSSYEINNPMQTFTHSFSEVSQSEMGIIPSPSLSSDHAHDRARKTLRPLSYQLSSEQPYSMPPPIESNSTSNIESQPQPPPLVRIKQEPGLEEQRVTSCNDFNTPPEITSETLKDILFAKPPSCQPLPPPPYIKRNARKSLPKSNETLETAETYGLFGGDTPAHMANAPSSKVADRGSEDLLTFINEACDQVVASNNDNLPPILPTIEKPKTTARKSLPGQKNTSDNLDISIIPTSTSENHLQHLELTLPVKREIQDSDVLDPDSSLASIDFGMQINELSSKPQTPDLPLQHSFLDSNSQGIAGKDQNATGQLEDEMEKPCGDTTINALKRKINALIDRAHEPQKKKKVVSRKEKPQEPRFFHCPSVECSFCTSNPIDFATHLSNDEMGLIYNSKDASNESKICHLNDNSIKQSTYQCILCNKFRTRSLAILTYHIYKEIQYKPYKCQVCSQTFVSSNYFIRHFRAIHGDQKPSHHLILDMKRKWAGEVVLSYIQATQFVDPSEQAPTSGMDEYKFHCPDCGIKLRDPIELQRHLFRDQKYFPFKCLHCHRSFIEYETSHFRNKHPNMPIKYYKTTIEEIEKRVVQIVEEQKLIRDSKREAKKFLKKYNVFRCVFAENCTFETTMVDILETHIICHLSSSMYKCAYCFVTTNFIDKLKSHYHKYHKGSPVMILNTKEVLTMQQQVSEKNKKDLMMNGLHKPPLDTERESIVITPSDFSMSTSSHPSPLGSSLPSPSRPPTPQDGGNLDLITSEALPNNSLTPLSALSSMNIPNQIESQDNCTLPSSSLDSIVYRLKHEMLGQDNLDFNASNDNSLSSNANLAPPSQTTTSPSVSTSENVSSLAILSPTSSVVTSSYSAGAYKVTHFNKPPSKSSININEYFRHVNPKKNQKKSANAGKKRTKPVKPKANNKPVSLQAMPPPPPPPKPKLAKDLINDMSLSTLEKISEGYFKPKKREVPNVRTILMQKQFLKALEATEKLDNATKDNCIEDNLHSTSEKPPSPINESPLSQLLNEPATKESGINKSSLSLEDAPPNKSVTSRKSLIPASSSIGTHSPIEPSQRKMTARKSLLPKGALSPCSNTSSVLSSSLKRTARKSMRPATWTPPFKQKARKSFSTAKALEEFSYYKQPSSPLDTSSLYCLIPFNICENMIPLKVKYDQLAFDSNPQLKLTSVFSPFFVDTVKS